MPSAPNEGVGFSNSPLDIVRDGNGGYLAGRIGESRPYKPLLSTSMNRPKSKGKLANSSRVGSSIIYKTGKKRLSIEQRFRSTQAS
jgi:hypothetical protein